MFMVDIHNVSTKQNNINLIVLFLGRLSHLGDLLLLVFVLQKLQSQLLTCLMCSIFMVREIYIIIFMALPSPGHHTRGQICKRSHIVKKILYSNTNECMAMMFTKPSTKNWEIFGPGSGCQAL